MAKTISIQIWIIFGYLLIILLIGGIAYTWSYEWQKVESLEYDNQQINKLQKEINDIHIHLIEFSLAGETILDWDDEDLEHYHLQRMAIDSVLCNFKTTYSVERVDSVRYLLEDKERQMRQIAQILDEQQAVNRKISNQVPIIVNSPRNSSEKVSWASSAKKRKRSQRQQRLRFIRSIET